jgi:hypothetical protein
MNPKIIFIISSIVIGAVFILASYKSRTRLDPPLLSNHSKFVIGFLLIFVGACFSAIIFLKGGF